MVSKTYTVFKEREWHQKCQTKCISKKRVQNILSWVQLPIEFGSTLNKIAAAGGVKEGVAHSETVLSPH